MITVHIFVVVILSILKCPCSPPYTCKRNKYLLNKYTHGQVCVLCVCVCVCVRCFGVKSMKLCVNAKNFILTKSNRQITKGGGIGAKRKRTLVQFRIRMNGATQGQCIGEQIAVNREMTQLPLGTISAKIYLLLLVTSRYPFSYPRTQYLKPLFSL